MKLITKLLTPKSIILGLSLIVLLTLLTPAESARSSEVESKIETQAVTEVETDSEKKHKKKKINAALKTRVKKLREQETTKVKETTSASTNNGTNLTLQKTKYKDLNDTYVKHELNQFKDPRRNWDFKVLDKQLEDIFNAMNMRDGKFNQMHADRPFMQIFFDQFANCDKNNDNVISLQEFQPCLKNDTYLSKILPPPQVWAAHQNYTDPNFFYNFIFNIMDTHQTGYLNFHAYMELRLMVFSWRKCSVNGPFIEETSWECAIEVVAGFKTSSRTLLRNTFYMCLELSNSHHIRNLDFISFLIYASSARLYGKINGKEDHDLSKSEFNLVLDENMLPSRYNQFVVDTMFKLIHEDDLNFEGIDLQTFIWYDFALRLFEQKNATRRWHLNEPEFTNTLANFLFPNKMSYALSQIPMNNFTNMTYQMYTYLNISQFHDEHDFLIKFAQKKEEVKEKKSNLKTYFRTMHRNAGKQIYNLATTVPYSLNFTAKKLFNLIDVNSDNLIDWYDYGQFFQVANLFTKFDPYQRGKIAAGFVYENYTSYSEFPRVSSALRHRANRFNLLNQDVYLDVFSVLTILRIDDLVVLYTRKLDPSTLYEVELKRIFSKCNLRYLPEAHMNKCLRGFDHLNVPKYDWECAFMQGFQDNTNYLESASSFNTMASNNLTMLNTVFNNVDPQIRNANKRFM